MQLSAAGVVTWASLRGAFFGVDNNAGIATHEGEVFEDLDRAPSASDAYVTDVPIELELGVVYADAELDLSPDKA